MPALALTDHGNMFGAIEFYKAARKAGIKPIVGMEAYTVSGDMREKKNTGTSRYNHMTLLVKDAEGYRNLVKLSSAAYLEGFYYKPRVDFDTISKHARGIIALSGCVKGPVAELLYYDKYDEARQAAGMLRDMFGAENFFIEIMDHNLEIEKKVLPQLIKISRDLEIPLVATNDSHYLCQDHSEAQDALVCIQTNKEINDPKRLKFETHELFLKSPEQMYTLFGNDYEDALKRTLDIAERCNLEIELGKHYLPRFPHLEEGETEESRLEKMAYEGAHKRYGEISEEIKKRLDYELEIIRGSGFPGYFLITADFVQYAKRQGIPVGPGRGSAAGSLVSYCLEITNIDPLRYNLLFERFLNPERVSMPDIDIDFSDRGREKVITYIKETYGEENVTQIITFGTMAAKAVVRDVGRVMGLPFGDVDRIAKMIPNELKMTLDKALERSAELRDEVERDPQVAKLLEISQTLEGMNRHASTHAAAVVIAPGPLTDFVPLHRNPSTGDITTQYDKDFVEEVGLLKMDILGLRTLTVIQDALDMIEENYGVKIDLDRLEFDNNETFDIFKRGETVGIFQFESSGMREYLKKLQPDAIEDITAMNALYRPGPLGANMVDEFIKRKHGETKVVYPHPMLEEVLKETYGVIVYQEQVMQIASRMAGFSLGMADQLRRAMGKKKIEVMEQQKIIFLEGAEENVVDLKKAEEVFELMAYFAGYGFNKSHSAGYAVLAYHTAYLKAHYPAEFLAATLTSEMTNQDRLAVFLEECRRMRIPVLPPDINESGISFTVVGSRIRFGLAAVKNVGKGVCEVIIEARRKDGPFISLGDFIERCSGEKSINRRLVESLIMAGALRSLPGEPEQHMLALEETLDFCHRRMAEKLSGQIGLFELGGNSTDSSNVEPDYPPLEERFKAWTVQQHLDYEKELLGFYISGHPLERFSEEIDAFCNTNAADFEDFATQRESRIKIGGTVNSMRVFFDKKNREFAIITLEDRTGSVDIFVFSEVFERYRELLSAGSFILVSGKYSKRDRDDSGKLTADCVVALEDIRSDMGVGLEVTLDTAKADDSFLLKLRDTLLKYRGENSLYMRVREQNGDYLMRSRQIGVQPSDELIGQLRDKLGRDRVRLVYHPVAGSTGPADPMYTFLNGPQGGNGRNGRNGNGGGFRKF